MLSQSDKIFAFEQVYSLTSDPMVPTTQVDAPQLSLAGDTPLPILFDGDGALGRMNPEGDSIGRHGKIHEREDEGAGAGSGTGDESESERCRRLVRTTAHVLDNVLELRYSTADHPLWGAGEAGNYQFQLRVEPDDLTVVCTSPLRIPADQRARAADFVARANYRINMGHFDLDARDGELRFRLVQHTTGLAETPALIAKFFALAHGTMDMHFAALMKLTYGSMSPEEAVQSCQGRERQSRAGSDTTSSGQAFEQ
jgi:hypothetical protein